MWTTPIEDIRKAAHELGGSVNFPFTDLRCTLFVTAYELNVLLTHDDVIERCFKRRRVRFENEPRTITVEEMLNVIGGGSRLRLYAYCEGSTPWREALEVRPGVHVGKPY